MRSADSNSPETPPIGDIASQASAWLARRDRGFTPAEQDAYLEWLRADSRHGAAVTRIEAAWNSLDQLSEWRPAHSSRPNPDLLAVPRRKRWAVWGSAVAMAAAFAVMLVVAGPFFDSAPTARAVRHSEVRTLADGSVVELNRDAEIAVDFSDTERVINLLRGEAHFTVAKNPARPFIVTAGGVRVRAVGTVFNVRMAGEAVDVLVTEGKVRIDPPKPAEVDLVVNAAMLHAGERTVVSASQPTPVPPAVVAASEREIEEALSWQGLRIEFNDTPLADAIAEFNRHSGTRFEIADDAIASLRIGGNFRADNAEAFVRLLSGFGVAVERDHAGRVVLRPSAP